MLIATKALLGFGAMRRAKTINDEMIAAHAYLENEAVLNDIPADLYLADILVPAITSSTLRSQPRLIGNNSSTSEPLSGHGSILAASGTEGNRAVQELRKEVRAYWSRFNRCSTGIRRSSRPKLCLF